MVVPYSGTQFSCRDYIEGAIKERLDKGVDAPFTAFDASIYLNRSCLGFYWNCHFLCKRSNGFYKRYWKSLC